MFVCVNCGRRVAPLTKKESFDHAFGVETYEVKYCPICENENLLETLKESSYLLIPESDTSKAKIVYNIQDVVDEIHGNHVTKVIFFD